MIWLCNYVPLFPGKKLFFWFIVILIGFTIRQDNAGVTSFIRATLVDPRCYTNLCRFFSSSAIDLIEFSRLWVRLCLKIFEQFLYVLNDRIVILVDGIKMGAAKMHEN